MTLNTVIEIGVVGTSKDDEILRILENIFIQRLKNSYVLLRFDENNDETSPSYEEVVNTLAKVRRLIICIGEESTDIGFILNKALVFGLSTCVLVKSGAKIDPVIEKIQDKNLQIVKYQDTNELNTLI